MTLNATARFSFVYWSPESLTHGIVLKSTVKKDFDHFVNFVRLLYVAIDGSSDDIWHGVKNALGILQVAVELGCPQIVTACVNYLEAVPWEEAEEEEILRVIPGMGSQAEPILARLRP
ncbi:hypothetical protein GH714_042414 [Hevea brasiliensis]|uniref:Uncharacterized protein n=1 Tax=Hevea brasiliensis TaxID=3981 RepID=A0A6A6NFA3_HEVBR|nr:hypothetical protein GH714_042414 [Hevea brasiliensis]